MRLSYYVFPDNMDEKILLENGCTVVLKDGREIFSDSIPDNKRCLVDHVSTVCGPSKISWIKRMMKTYGGSGYTEHYDRDGSLFETSSICLQGNNSEFIYNRHL